MIRLTKKIPQRQEHDDKSDEKNVPAGKIQIGKPNDPRGDDKPNPETE